MRRRSFLTGLTALAATPPAAAHAAERMRFVAVLFSLPLDNPVVRVRLAALREQLARRGWEEGRNLRLLLRPAGADERVLVDAARELVREGVEVIVVGSSAEAAAALSVTKTIPVLFGTASDPVGSGFVRSLDRPDSNATGFSNNDPSMCGKWVELLTEIAPATRRIGLIYNPATAAAGGVTYVAQMRTAAAERGVAILDHPIFDPTQIEPAIAALAENSETGLMFPPDSFTYRYARACAAAAAHHRLPAIYVFDTFVTQGGLMSYTGGRDESSELIASYIDLVLRGANVAELPVQFSRSFELVINERAAADLGLTLPMSLRVRATRIVA
ncbi:ABC transporter substrate-binding protein [Bosea caraganae]|uniref:ABC transporter substrate-binding protein n=1 Tax=Bosea caraganae TaxID=2763117 RepID=A0A370L9T1_9HYPH|nr:ABC transporter substrate-binding protein [Bosea caraganae]RDJ21987.1 ABC transporter substrate-binding protein [Bosea caraganae]RDJ27979.1 ABC transporter substrate-binding protein [Bosea caraganae]